MTSGAVVMDLSSLATQNGTSGAITLSKITNFNAPKLDTSGVVSIVAATDITIKDYSAGTNIYALAAKNIVTKFFFLSFNSNFFKDCCDFCISLFPV